MPAILLSGNANRVTVHREGTRVQLLVDGRLAADMPWQAAELIARALWQNARQAEQLDEIERVIYDQAIVTRLGLPVGFSRHPYVLKEACKEAAWNSGLRRYIRGDRAKGMVSQEVFGTPTVIRRNP